MAFSVQQDFLRCLLKLGLTNEYSDITVVCRHNNCREEMRMSKLLLATACPSLQAQLRCGSEVVLPLTAPTFKAALFLSCGLALDECDPGVDVDSLWAAAAVLNLDVPQLGQPQAHTSSGILRPRHRFLNSQWANWAFILLLCIAVLAAWVPMLHYTMESFFMDDSMIARNPNVYMDLDVLRLFCTDYWGLDLFAGTWTHKSFRPLTVLTFRWNYLLHGFHSAGFHNTNLCIHLLCSGFLGIVGTHAGLTRQWAGLLALLFCAHPVHTESVLYIVGRADLLCLFLILAAISVHSAYGTACGGFRQNWVILLGMTLSCGLLIAAGLCKETGFCFFGLLIVWDILRLATVAKPRAWLQMRSMLLLLVGFLSCAFRVWFTGTTIERMDPHSNPVAAEENASVRFLSYALVHGMYGKLLAWPARLCYDYSYDAVPLVRSFSDVRLLLPLAAYASFAQMLTVAAGRFRYRAFKNTVFEAPLLGIAIFLLGFVPMSNILFPVGTMIAERLLYIPSAGLLLALCGFAQQQFSATWLPKFAAVVGILHAHLTAQRVLEWSSPESITVADAAKQKRSVRVQYNFGAHLLSAQRYDEALSAFRLVMEIDPSDRDCMPLYRAGQIHFYQKNYAVAEQLLEKAVQGQFSPLILNEEEVFHDYALALWFMEKPHDAVMNFEKSLAINSTFTKGLNNLGCALGLGALFGRLPSEAMHYGIDHLQQAISLNPRSLLYWRNLVALLRFAEEEDIAKRAWEEVLTLDPAGSLPEDCSWEFALR